MLQMFFPSFSILLHSSCSLLASSAPFLGDVKVIQSQHCKSSECYPACREDHWTTFRIAIHLKNKQLQFGSLGNSYNLITTYKLVPDFWGFVQLICGSRSWFPWKTCWASLETQRPRNSTQITSIVEHLVLRRLLVFWYVLMWDCSILPSSLQSSSFRTFKTCIQAQAHGLLCCASVASIALPTEVRATMRSRLSEECINMVEAALSELSPEHVWRQWRHT